MGAHGYIPSAGWRDFAYQYFANLARWGREEHSLSKGDADPSSMASSKLEHWKVSNREHPVDNRVTIEHNVSVNYRKVLAAQMRQEEPPPRHHPCAFCLQPYSKKIFQKKKVVMACEGSIYPRFFPTRSAFRLYSNHVFAFIVFPDDLTPALWRT